MSHYLVHATYTPRAWVARPPTAPARRTAVQRLFERAGARLEAWYDLGERDVVAIVQLCTGASLAAFARQATASGLFEAFRTAALAPADGAVGAGEASGAPGMSRAAVLACGSGGRFDTASQR